MSSWINWAALGKILGVGLLAGAGLPALFAIGLRLITPADHLTNHPVGVTSSGALTEGASGVRANPVALLAGLLCFAVVLAAIGYGIYIIVEG